MKPTFVILLILPLSMTGQVSEFGREFRPVWQRACAYTLEVAAAMPDSLYDYRPDSAVMTFGEHLVHLSNNLYSLNSRFFLASESPAETPGSASDKAAVMARLQAAFAYVDSSLLTLRDADWAQPAPGFWNQNPGTKRVVLLLMRDHMTHHRGALVLYLRMNGITPPRFRGW